MISNSQINQIWWPLRLTFGLVPVAAGADKFFNLLTNWSAYVAPPIAHLVPGGGGALMHIVGVVEMAVGVLILTRWTRVGAYIASMWLLSIAANLLLSGSFLDIAVRDIALAVGAYTLARISELRDPVEHRAASPASPSAVRA